MYAGRAFVPAHDNQEPAADMIITLPCSSRSIAAALAIRKVCPKILELHKKRTIYSMVVSDRQAVTACNRFAGEFFTLCRY
ncbi:hypothetical protein HPB48_010465 [Haemaphysalis longicornis]|uniref:Uncharacterized protein n=1 Tax=Haemaphysalis longicornis TaxID=44386 RepID=A0A9J6H2P1_HAELO|nr:hypothetical protein HPB48_010465 [Haemaphysalis longicornis]